MATTSHSFSSLLLELGSAVGESDIELSGPLDDVLSLLGRHVVGDFSGEGPVVHKEQFNIFFIANEELLEAASEEVAGGVVLLLANGGHGDVASESASDSGIDTMGLSPGRLRVTLSLP